MEKLVQRHFRKEPRLACRAGLLAYALLPTLFAFSPVHAQPFGTPAKAIRFTSPSRAVSDAAPHAMSAVVAELSPADVRRTPAHRRAALSTGPYLPVTGALPLRFSAAPKWPAPLPKTEPQEHEAVATVASTPAPAVPPVVAPTARPAEAAANAPAPIASPVVVQKVADVPAKAAPTPTALTSDMILGYLGNLPPPETRVSVRFEPAIPQGGASRPSDGSGVLGP